LGNLRDLNLCVQVYRAHWFAKHFRCYMPQTNGTQVS
jgi:hypothetical protein